MKFNIGLLVAPLLALSTQRLAPLALQPPLQLETAPRLGKQRSNDSTAAEESDDGSLRAANLAVQPLDSTTDVLVNRTPLDMSFNALLSSTGNESLSLVLQRTNEQIIAEEKRAVERGHRALQDATAVQEAESAPSAVAAAPTSVSGSGGSFSMPYGFEYPLTGCFWPTPRFHIWSWLLFWLGFLLVCCCGCCVCACLGGAVYWMVGGRIPGGEIDFGDVQQMSAAAGVGGLSASMILGAVAQQFSRGEEASDTRSERRPSRSKPGHARQVPQHQRGPRQAGQPPRSSLSKPSPPLQSASKHTPTTASPGRGTPSMSVDERLAAMLQSAVEPPESTGGGMRVSIAPTAVVTGAVHSKGGRVSSADLPGHRALRAASSDEAGSSSAHASMALICEDEDFEVAYRSQPPPDLSKERWMTPATLQAELQVQAAERAEMTAQKEAAKAEATERAVEAAEREAVRAEAAEKVASRAELAAAQEREAAAAEREAAAAARSKAEAATAAAASSEEAKAKLEEELEAARAREEAAAKRVAETEARAEAAATRAEAAEKASLEAEIALQRREEEANNDKEAAVAAAVAAAQAASAAHEAEALAEAEERLARQVLAREAALQERFAAAEREAEERIAAAAKLEAEAAERVQRAKDVEREAAEKHLMAQTLEDQIEARALAAERAATAKATEEARKEIAAVEAESQRMVAERDAAAVERENAAAERAAAREKAAATMAAEREAAAAERAAAEIRAAESATKQVLAEREAAAAARELDVAARAAAAEAAALQRIAEANQTENEAQTKMEEAERVAQEKMEIARALNDPAELERVTAAVAARDKSAAAAKQATNDERAAASDPVLAASLAARKLMGLKTAVGLQRVADEKQAALTELLQEIKGVKETAVQRESKLSMQLEAESEELPATPAAATAVRKLATSQADQEAATLLQENERLREQLMALGVQPRSQVSPRKGSRRVSFPEGLQSPTREEYAARKRGSYEEFEPSADPTQASPIRGPTSHPARSSVWTRRIVHDDDYARVMGRGSVAENSAPGRKRYTSEDRHSAAARMQAHVRGRQQRLNEQHAALTKMLSAKRLTGGRFKVPTPDVERAPESVSKRTSRRGSTQREDTAAAMQALQEARLQRARARASLDPTASLLSEASKSFAAGSSNQSFAAEPSNQASFSEGQLPAEAAGPTAAVLATEPVAAAPAARRSFGRRDSGDNRRKRSTGEGGDA